MPALTAVLFGTPHFYLGKKEIIFPYRKAAALFIYLLMQKEASRSSLADTLWDNVNSETALKNLRHASYTVRKSLGMNPFLMNRNDIITLDPAFRFSCDAVSFLREENPDLCTGEFLKGFHLKNASLYEQWTSEWRRKFHSLYLKSLMKKAETLSEAGELEKAETCLETYLQHDPLEESVAVQLMKILRQQGKFRRAVSVYTQLNKELSRELGVNPSEEASALVHEIEAEWNSDSPSGPAAEELVFAKQTLLNSLLAFCWGLQDWRGRRAALITGEAGSGKTFLLDQLLNHHDFSDFLICRCSCYESESKNALVPWNALLMHFLSEVERCHISIPESYLRAAANLFPGLNLGTSDVDKGTGLEERLSARNPYLAEESVFLMLLSASSKLPLLLIFEDLQWMDNSSIDLLSQLLRRISGSAITVICTSRDSMPFHLKQMISNARHDNVMDVFQLQPFSPEETARFLRSRLHREVPASEISELYSITGGNPRLLMQLSDASVLSGPASLSSRAGSIIRKRILMLPEDERRVLDLVAVFRDPIPLAALSDLLGADTVKLAYLCSQLKQRQFLGEILDESTVSYYILHEEIRSALISAMDPGTMRTLHLQAARWLEANVPEDRIEIYLQLASHYRAAGDNFHDFRYRVLSLNAYTAAYYAVYPVLSSNSETLGISRIDERFATLEAELLHFRENAIPAQQAELDQLEMLLLHAKSSYCVYVGLYSDALPALLRLTELSHTVQDRDMERRACLQYVFYGIQTWNVPIMQTKIDQGMALFEEADWETEMYGIFLRMEGLLLSMKGLYEESRSVLGRSVSLFRKLAQSSGTRYAIHIAGSYNYIAESYRMEGNFEKATEFFEKCLSFNRRRGYYPGAAVFYGNAGVCAFQRGARRLARQLFDSALATYRASHELSGRPITMSYLALYAMEEGSSSEAEQYLREAFAVSDQIKSPWWKGITLYVGWKIRVLMQERGISAPEIEALFPQSPEEHIRQCLELLHQISPRTETVEMENEQKRLTEKPH